jgi:hypothetical protein
MKVGLDLLILLTTLFSVALASNYDSTDKIRDRIYSELHNNILLTYGVSETGSRMGALLCLLHDLNVRGLLRNQTKPCFR